MHRRDNGFRRSASAVRFLCARFCILTSFPKETKLLFLGFSLAVHASAWAPPAL